jgi:hypothetical protein
MALRTITPEQLKHILAQHKLWCETDGREGERANLCGANLYRANLYGANLRKANLCGANLSGANLRRAKLPDFQLCPPRKKFLGWKKVRDGVVLELHITGKRTSSLVGRKCRCSEAVVLAAYDSDGNNLEDGRIFKSVHDENFTYKVGQTVRESKYDDDIRVECTTGIHFFMTRKEAEEYEG